MDQNFSLIFKKNLPFKLRIVISKKVAQKAVDRNRIKRIFRAAVRKIQPAHELVIIVKKNIKELKAQQVEKILIEKIKKVK